VDWIRTAYTTRMKLWKDSEETVEVRWFRAEPGAKIFPGVHNFSSLTWRDEHKPEYRINNTGIGEQTEAGRVYDRGQNLNGYDGQRFCGSLKAWREGGVHGTDPPLALDSEGRPACCQGPWQARGGSVEGGTRGPESTTQTTRGGEVEGGAALQATAPVLLAAGGEVEGGASLLGGGFRSSASGGQIEGGAALFFAFPWVAAGGQQEGGTGRFIPKTWLASGGEQQGGAALQQGFPLPGLGGEIEGGAALFITGPLRATGGQLEGGAADFASAFFAVRGGAVDGGSGFPWLTAGGEAEGGAADFQTSLHAGYGGEVQGGAAGQQGFPVLGSGGGVTGGAALFLPPATPGYGGEVQGGAADIRAVVWYALGGEVEGGIADQSGAVPVEDVLTGTVLSWAGTGAVPAGYLKCDGSTVSRTTYSALFGVIGTTYGAGDGSTTFRLPDIRGSFPTMGGGGAGVGGPGATGGNYQATLSVANLPAHVHGVPGRARTASVTTNANGFERGDNTAASDLQTDGGQGNATPFNIMPPYLSMTFLIKT